MAVLRGFSKAGGLHSARLRSAPLGHFFNVISNGYGSMPDYAAQVTPADRWAIVAYIRALQLSQYAQSADVPAGKHVESLKNIAESEGLPVSFAAEQKLPGTSVTGTPNGKLFVLPETGGSPGAATAPAPAKPQPTGAATKQ
jgi:hypothetical protein